MKKVIVTGAAGFIGRHCLPLLAEKGYEVHAVDLKKERDGNTEINWHNADLLNTEEMEDLISRIKATHLLHLAWYTEHKKYWVSPENYNWVKASLALVRAFHAYGGKRVVAAGTCAEYDWKEGHCSEYKTPLLPATLYGVCRNASRENLEAFSKENSMSSAWGRIFFVYGPGEHPARLVSSVICSLLQGKPVPCSEGNQKRDFLFVEDVASAFAAILSSDIEGAVNIGSGTPVSVKEIIDTISDKIGRPDLIRFGELPSPPNDPPLLTADIRRLKKDLHWHSRYGLDEGLDKTIQWWKDYLKKE